MNFFRFINGLLGMLVARCCLLSMSIIVFQVVVLLIQCIEDLLLSVANPFYRPAIAEHLSYTTQLT